MLGTLQQVNQKPGMTAKPAMTQTNTGPTMSATYRPAAGGFQGGPPAQAQSLTMGRTGTGSMLGGGVQAQPQMRPSPQQNPMLSAQWRTSSGLGAFAQPHMQQMGPGAAFGRPQGMNLTGAVQSGRMSPEQAQQMGSRYAAMQQQRMPMRRF